MAYNKIEICMFVIFLHSLLLTPCISQSNSSDAPTTKPLSKEAPKPPIQLSSPIVTNTPKIIPYYGNCIPPNLTNDAITLEKAMQGFGTDVFTIIDLVYMRNNNQRQEIRKEYKRLYNKDLIEELESELSGNLRTTVVSLMLTNHQFYAKELHDAMNGLGTDNEALSEILGTLNSTEIQEISGIYEMEYRRKLIDDIIDDTSGSFKKLLVLLCEANRDSDNSKTRNEVYDTRNLILAGLTSLLKHTTAEEDTLIDILTSRSFSHLKKIFDEYFSLKHRDIITSISGRFPKSFEYALLTIIQRAYSKNEYYANQLNSAMAHFITNNRQLIRIIVGRSEIDLDDIKISYERMFGVPLIDRVSDETSGDYRNLLMAILRK